MHALQHAVPRFIQFGNPLRRRASPCEEYHAVRPFLRHNINDLLRELLPPLIRMTVGLVRSHRQTRIEKQYATVCPRGEQTSFLRRRFEAVRVFFLEKFIDICKGWGRRGGRADGEAKTVSLVWTMVRILAEDDAFNCIERCVAGP